MNGLEQILEFAPQVRQNEVYQAINFYMPRTIVLYTPPLKCFSDDDSFGQIKMPKSPINPFVIPYGDLTGEGGDVHDTFKIDRYDNLYGGHTSIKIPGWNPIRISWIDEDE